MPDRRRAGLGSGRLGPGPGDQPAAGAAGAARADRAVRRARPAPGAPHLAPGRGHVSRPDRRAGPDRAPVQRAAPPLHASAARRRAGARSDPAQAHCRGPRRAAEPGRDSLPAARSIRAARTCSMPAAAIARSCSRCPAAGWPPAISSRRRRSSTRVDGTLGNWRLDAASTGSMLLGWPGTLARKDGEAEIDGAAAARRAVEATEQQGCGFAADVVTGNPDGGERRHRLGREIEAEKAGDADPLRHRPAAPLAFEEGTDGEGVARAEDAVGVRPTLEQRGEAVGAAANLGRSRQRDDPAPSSAPGAARRQDSPCGGAWRARCCRRPTDEADPAVAAAVEERDQARHRPFLGVADVHVDDATAEGPPSRPPGCRLWPASRGSRPCARCLRARQLPAAGE